MTTNEFKEVLNEKYGIGKWPQILEVDAETYGNVCQSLFDWKVKNEYYPVTIELGPNNGILFKNIELIKK